MKASVSLESIYECRIVPTADLHLNLHVRRISRSFIGVVNVVIRQRANAFRNLYPRVYISIKIRKV